MRKNLFIASGPQGPQHTKYLNNMKQIKKNTCLNQDPPRKEENLPPWNQQSHTSTQKKK